jgi:hypothetical protein
LFPSSTDLPAKTTVVAVVLTLLLPVLEEADAQPGAMLGLVVRQVFAVMERERRIPRVESAGWEDALIAWHLQQAHPRTGEDATPDRRHAR